MGSFQETCALTATPIYYGERCMMVILDEEWTKRIRNHESVVGYIGSTYQWRPFRAFHRGTYEDYGWINELDSEPYKKDLHQPPCLFFHESVWDWAAALPTNEIFNRRLQWEQDENESAIERAKDLPKELDETETDRMWDLGLLVYSPEFLAFRRICEVAKDLRRDIFGGLTFRGHQESSLDATRQEFIDHQIRIFGQHKKRFEE